MRTYSNLIKLQTFEDRFNYLKLSGSIGKETFGFDRYFNQVFYRSVEWKKIRDFVIVRDNGCDLGMAGYEIQGSIIVHHMNPFRLEDLEKKSDILLNPEYLITTVLNTHNAIHYSDYDLIKQEPIKRFKNDTCPWKKDELS